MTKKHRPRDEQAWANAKTICRLTTRQVEMARALGLNPRKLPGLRPNPHERWKLPVGQFIEERYRKRFGGHPHDHGPRGSDPSSHKRSGMHRDARVPGRAEVRLEQASSLVCYLTNLAGDLEAWLEHGSIEPDVLQQVREELQEIVEELATGAPISEMPAIPVPRRPVRDRVPRRDDEERRFEDDEIPF